MHLHHLTNRSDLQLLNLSIKITHANKFANLFPYLQNSQLSRDYMCIITKGQELPTVKYVCGSHEVWFYTGGVQETENLPLVEQIQYFLSNKIMAPLEFPSNGSMQETTSAATQSEMPTTHFSSTASLTQPSSYQPAVGNLIQFPSCTGLITSEDLNQPELNSPLAVPEQTWR
jgi:hypothetical protein